jgi:hypothetical protein
MNHPDDCSLILSNAAARENKIEFGPFVPGASYRVRKNFAADRDSFVEGEILIYRRSAISRYDAMAGYFFEDGKGEIRSWDLEDTESTGIWSGLFELVGESQGL